jgi:hypothetical protein
MQIGTIADITPNGSKVALANVSTRAIWIDMTASGTSIRTGDSNIGAARGVVLQTGVLSRPYPRQDNPQQPYDLANVYVYGGSGTDKVSITYAY